MTMPYATISVGQIPGSPSLSCASSPYLVHYPVPLPLFLLQGQQTRQVVHLHYLSWPDYGVPSEVFPIFNLIDRMNLLKKPGEHGPPVIHCR